MTESSITESKKRIHLTNRETIFSAGFTAESFLNNFKMRINSLSQNNAKYKKITFGIPFK
jgi:hypothetical protein